MPATYYKPQSILSPFPNSWITIAWRSRSHYTYNVLSTRPFTFLRIFLNYLHCFACQFVTFLLTFKITGVFWPFNWVRIWRLLFQALFSRIVTIWLQNCLEYYEMAFFAGSYIEGSFSGMVLFQKFTAILIWFHPAFSAQHSHLLSRSQSWLWLFC